MEDLIRIWNNLDRDEKLETIEDGIDAYTVSEGFLMLRLFRKNNIICAAIRDTLDNHLCVEAVSQDTLIELFGDDHEFQANDAETILKWMESNK